MMMPRADAERGGLRLLRALALYKRCYQLAAGDFSIEIVEFIGVCTGEPGILHWRIGHRGDSEVRCRGRSMTAKDDTLLTALKDAHLFLRRIRRQSISTLNVFP